MVVADEDGQNVAVSAEQGVEAAVVAHRETREENQVTQKMDGCVLYVLKAQRVNNLQKKGRNAVRPGGRDKVMGLGSIRSVRDRN